MSDKKKVIHVKDLVIKADNVYVEPPRRPHRRMHPFGFGPRRHEESMESDFEKQEYESSSFESDERDGRRGPFSWI